MQKKVYTKPDAKFIFFSFGDDVIATSDSCYQDYQTNTWDEIDEGTCTYYSATYMASFPGL